MDKKIISLRMERQYFLKKPTKRNISGCIVTLSPGRTCTGTVLDNRPHRFNICLSTANFTAHRWGISAMGPMI